MKNDRFYQFCGENAIGADLDAREAAQKMIENGRDPELTRQATGWFCDIDQKWKFEISDHEVELDEENFQSLVDGHKEGEPRFFFLPEIVRHPTIYSYYPHLLYVRVTSTPLEGIDGGERGSYCPNSRLLELNVLRDPQEALSTALHEIQHSIQFKEGFAFGGMPSDMLKFKIKDALATDSFKTKMALSDWKVRNSHKLLELDRLREELQFAMLFRSMSKLLDYSQSDRPSGLKRHIMNESGWLMGELFTDSKSGRMTPQADNIIRSRRDMPKSNSRGQRDRFLSDFSFGIAKIYKERIPPLFLAKLKEDERAPLSIIKAYERQISRLNTELRPMKVLETSHTKAVNIANESRYLCSYDVYHRLAGETEARTTQSRMHLTDSERLETPKSKSQDVRSEHQFVVLASGKFVGESEMVKALSKSPEIGKPEAKGEMVLGGSYFAEVILNDKADASTVVHEAAHVFLEIHSELAKDLPASNDLRKDFASILSWQGLTEEQWHSMALDQRREVHEQFAVSFEKFLAGGRTEEPALIAMFLKFKEWFEDIYRGNNIFPETKVLTRDVESIFEGLISDSAQERSDFSSAIRDRLVTHSNISNCVAEMTSKVIDSSYGQIAARAGIDRQTFDQRFSVAINVPQRKESMKLSL